MCGIALLVSTSGNDERTTQDPKPSLKALYPAVQRSNRRRGPDQDAAATHTLVRQDGSQIVLSLTSSVLGLRGRVLTPQPLVSANGRFLLAWNGQIFDWDQPSSITTSSKAKLDRGENDGRLLFDTIVERVELLEAGQGASAPAAASSIGEAVRSSLAEVEGPYAFALVDKLAGVLVYGRDPLGRRSLLVTYDGEQGMMLASVSCLEAVTAGLDMQEADCASLWTVNLHQSHLESSALERQSSRYAPLRLYELDNPAATPTDLDVPSSSLEDRHAASAAFEAVLAKSVEARVTNIRTHGRRDEAHVAVLFSGGLDCATLARLADRFVPLEQPIDLLNVAFENPRAIKAARLEAERARLRACKQQAPRRRRAAFEAGQEASPLDSGDRGQADATSAAALDVALPEVDIYDVPDRLTGRATHAELVALAPRRRWNFVEINVTYAEYCEARETVMALMHPTASVMDLSIASALFFASRGYGHVVEASSMRRQAYTTPARVLISGLGADELLGGYSRHRNAFARHGWAGLVEELQLDLARLPTRNLGRDDRILSTHGREARYPFLAHPVLSHLCSLPVPAKTDPRMGEGTGDKLLLRDLASSPSIGLVGAARLKKRAMQFGTRAAKIDEGQGNVKGHESIK
ncbi:uncharacterized protein PFL1_02294 [Pseudozyma flocculosa PF-1]|uniref:Glutamine amidotransferase type-2 domain-containing protein n=1 Tax=Pseudozyma flocculosa TaxID=84751 RepID=A0A5C3F762_9BASI|nr:uncharacterized protein PFL1_02294 [Pseudozyma flocculosa PF-1]EPQ30178.1 hypothetical protein PFL1_02294 [Pseudozyma flocculosa PF-1]SPO39896.1 uncharacterized protein PSFLO_05377 [Pseudozyma flocculosa]